MNIHHHRHCIHHYNYNIHHYHHSLDHHHPRIHKQPKQMEIAPVRDVYQINATLLCVAQQSNLSRWKLPQSGMLIK